MFWRPCLSRDVPLCKCHTNAELQEQWKWSGAGNNRISRTPAFWNIISRISWMLTLEGLGLGSVKNCSGLEPGLASSCMVHVAKCSQEKVLELWDLSRLSSVPHNNENHPKFMLVSSGTGAVKPLHVAVRLQLDWSKYQHLINPCTFSCSTHR